MASPILAFLAGAGAGYLNQSEREQQKDRQKAADSRATEEFEWKKTDRAQQDDLTRSLKDAGRPVAVVEGAGGMVRPDTMDNRDVGLPENSSQPNNGLMQGNYRVAGQSFADRTQADAAVAKQNTPEAVNNRVVAAYRGAGQMDKASQVESNARTAELQTMQLADTRWKRDLGMAMRGGHQGLATLATSSEAGPMAGLNVQVIPTADGKVTYGAVGADGKVAPIPGLPAFTNDQEGVTRAAWMLDQTITPEARMAHFTAEQTRAQSQKNNERDYKLKEREVDSKIELNTAKGENMMLRASIAASKGAKTEEPAQFDPLKDFDPKQARKAAMDQAIDEAKNTGKVATEAEIAKRAQGIYSALRTAASSENTNMHVQSTVGMAFRQAGSDPAAYAETYAKAQQVASPQQLAAWGFKPPGAGAGPKPARPGGGGQPVPDAPVSQPAPQPTATPADAAGARVDQARAALSALRNRPAPGMAAGRARIDEYAAQVQAARQAVAQAEAEYQRAVPNSGAAFVTPSM